METTVTGLFPDAESARRARLELEKQGVPGASIDVLTRDTANLHALLREETADAERGAAVGSVVAGLGMAIGASALALPPLSVFPVPWPYAAMGGAVCGVIAGGIIGLLIGSGTGHQVQEEYESLIERGGIVLAINTDRAHAHQALAMLRRCGGQALSTSVHRKHHVRATA